MLGSVNYLIMDKQAQIGLKIKLARQEANMTQEELGAKTGYSAMGISYLEKGLRDIKIKNLEIFSQVLNKDINFFLEPLVELEAPVRSATAFFRRGRDDLSEGESKEEKKSIEEFKNTVRALYNKK